VVAERHQVAQQPVAGDARAGVADLHAGPVRLAGDRAVGLEQMRDQDLVGLELRVRGQEVGARRAVVADLDRQVVDQVAFQRLDQGGVVGRSRGQHHAHRRAAGLGQVPHQLRAQRVGVGEAGLGIAAEVELEALGFDDVGRAGLHPELGQRDPRLAAAVEPAQLVGIPEIHAHERQLVGQAQRRPLRGAGDREQQGRVVLGAVIDGLAQGAQFGGGHGPHSRTGPPERRTKPRPPGKRAYSSAWR